MVTPGWEASNSFAAFAQLVNWGSAVALCQNLRVTGSAGALLVAGEPVSVADGAGAGAGEQPAKPSATAVAARPASPREVNLFILEPLESFDHVVESG